MEVWVAQWNIIFTWRFTARKKHLRVLNMLGNEHETEFCAEVPFFWSSPKISVKHPLGHRKNHPNPRSGWGHRGVTREGVPSGGSTGRSWNFSRNICSNVWIRGTVPPSCLGFGWWIAGVDPAGSGFWATHWGKPQWFDLGSDMSSELWRIRWEWLCRRSSPFFSVLLSQNDWCR